MDKDARPRVLRKQRTEDVPCLVLGENIRLWLSVSKEGVEVRLGGLHAFRRSDNGCSGTAAAKRSAHHARIERHVIPHQGPSAIWAPSRSSTLIRASTTWTPPLLTCPTTSTPRLICLRYAAQSTICSVRVGSISQGLVAANDQQYAPPGTFLHADFRMPEYDFYGQDSWRLRPNLTVDLGLRWEIRLSPRVTNAANMLHPDQTIDFGQPSSNTITWVPGQLYRDKIANRFWARHGL